MLYYANELFTGIDKEKVPSGAKRAYDRYQQFLMKHNKMNTITVFKSKKGVRRDASGKVMPTPPESIPFRAIDKQFGGMWVYSKYPLEKDANGNLKHNSASSAMELMYNNMTLDPKKDIDKIFFLSEVSPLHGISYVLEDKEMEAMHEFKKRSFDAELEYLIAADDSPLFKDSDYAVSIALAYGVPNADNLGPYELRKKLGERIKSLDQNKASTGISIESFLKEVKGRTPDIEKRAEIQKAIQMNAINFKHSPKSEWYYGDRENKYQELIFKLAPNDIHKKELALYEYFLTHPENFDVVTKILGGTVEKDIPTGLTVKEVEEINDYNELKAIAKEMNIIIFQKSKDDIKAEIISKLTKESQE